MKFGTDTGEYGKCSIKYFKVGHLFSFSSYLYIMYLTITVLYLILRMEKKNFNFEKRAFFLVKVVNRSIYIRYENS